jgi:pimeloyl-ACP methyl ester carboxylesterase
MTSSASGPELIFLHPIGLDQRIYAGVRRDGERALDFPGFGAAVAVDRVTLAGLADYVLGQITEPVTLVGVSLGGMVAQQVAVREPDAVASLVVACSNAVSHPATMAERAAATRAGGMAGILDTTLERWFTPEALATPDHPGVTYARQCLLDDDPELFAEYWEAMGEHNVAAQLPSIKVPATFIAGKTDRASSADTLRQMAEAVPQGTFEVIDGPHMLPLERADEFRVALDRHAGRLARTQ